MPLLRPSLRWALPLIAASAGAAGAVLWHASLTTCYADPPTAKRQDKSPLQQFMARKMDASSQILEGIVMENSDLIKQGGNSLLEMSRAEKFQVLTDQEYRLHNRQFREAVQRLIAAADKEGYGKAALAWFDVTISCVDCHDHVRKAPPAKALEKASDK